MSSIDTAIERNIVVDTTQYTAEILRQARNQAGGAYTNVSGLERTLSGLVGGTLIVAGLARRSLWSAAEALVGAGLMHRALTGRCMLYQSLGINTAQAGGFGQHNEAIGVPAKRGRKHETIIVINRPALELFDYWRTLHHLTKLFDHLISVVELGNGRSHWVARGPLGRRVEWDAELYTERPGEMLAWRSIAGSDLDTAGSIHFEPIAEEGRTVVTLSMKYNPPAGEIGSTVADWLGQSVEDELDEGLRRFRQLAEAGEVPTIEGQPHGTCRAF